MDTQTLTDVTTNVASQMSMWDMVWASDMVTKVVMIGLIATSVWSWAIIIEKIGTLRQVKRLSKAFEERPFCHVCRSVLSSVMPLSN